MLNVVKLGICKSLHFLQMNEEKVYEEEIALFEQIYENHIKNAEGETIPYSYDIPKSKFLNYLLSNKNLLVHGSTHSDIKQFEPRSSTLFTGKPINAVFASTDAMWSIFFAVIDKNVYKGSLRNICITATTKKGIRRFYYFSLEEYSSTVWSPGMIYLLPKDKFKQGGISTEWVSETVVQPIAKIEISPSDFIFKERVKQHHRHEPVTKSWFRALLLNK
ncbi:hypothetical protein [Bacillus alkalicellulosilyticus]|uniref:hypothetical protein n=1 Tax=Alkalihalobacterium alkalicellulosilyticum TaxID=1912214 RepID=UPI00099677BA|nr:hypothetical protein [Bacillus alkalicellulosilyticus]